MPELSTALKVHVTLANGWPVVGETRSGFVVVNAGHVRLGLVLSALTMLNEHMLALLALSVAVQVTVVVPKGTVTGLILVQETGVFRPELSVAVAVNVAVAVGTPAVGVTLMVDGHVMTGSASSAMVSGYTQVLESPARSNAVQLTLVVVETRKRRVPESGHVMLAMPDASLAVTFGANVTKTSGRRSVDRVVYESDVGHVIVGAVVSVMLTVNVHVATKFALSRAVQVTLVTPSGKTCDMSAVTEGLQEAEAIPLPSCALSVGVYAVTVTVGTPPVGEAA